MPTNDPIEAALEDAFKGAELLVACLRVSAPRVKEVGDKALSALATLRAHLKQQAETLKAADALAEAARSMHPCDAVSDELDGDEFACDECERDLCGYRDMTAVANAYRTLRTEKEETP